MGVVIVPSFQTCVRPIDVSCSLKVLKTLRTSLFQVVRLRIEGMVNQVLEMRIQEAFHVSGG